MSGSVLPARMRTLGPQSKEAQVFQIRPGGEGHNPRQTTSSTPAVGPGFRGDNAEAQLGASYAMMNQRKEKGGFPRPL